MFVQCTLTYVSVIVLILCSSTEAEIKVSDRFGNFSVEFLYHASKMFPEEDNIISSALTLWNCLAVTCEGSVLETASEIKYTARLPSLDQIRAEIQENNKWLDVNSTALAMRSTNRILAGNRGYMERDFLDYARIYHQFQYGRFNLTDKKSAAESIKQQIYSSNHGRLPNLVTLAYFTPSVEIDENDRDAIYLLISAFHFRGVWHTPFDATMTRIMSFYDHTGRSVVGEVAMMYNKHSYPLVDIKELQGSVVELPYGIDKRVSMLIMLPYPNVTIEDMMKNFLHVPLGLIFDGLKLSQRESKQIDCSIPKFRIHSDFGLNELLPVLGIHKLLDRSKAKLLSMNRWPYYVSKVVHKAEIEVTEQGTRAPVVKVDTEVTGVDHKVGENITSFIANRPFMFFIIEKMTSSIVAQGIIRLPTF